MTAPFKSWTVLPHGELTEIEPGMLTVVGEIHMPVGDLPRRMTVVRLRDRRLVIYSAIAMAEDEMRALENYGDPAFLIVPGDHHRLDAGAWKQRYPAIEVIAPRGAREAVEKAVAVDASEAAFGDKDVRLIEVAGCQGHELALRVDRNGGTTLVLNDIVANIRDERGFGGWLLSLMKFAGDEPQIPVHVTASIVKDKAALKAQLLAWAKLTPLKRIVVSHGQIIEADPAGALRAVAETLD